MLQQLESLFRNLTNVEVSPKLCLFRMNSGGSKTSFSKFAFRLHGNSCHNYLNALAKAYVGDDETPAEECELRRYESIVHYTSGKLENRIAYLPITDSLVEQGWEAFKGATEYAEHKWIDNLENAKYRGVIAQGRVPCGDFALFMVSSPIKQIKLTFSLIKNKFKEVSGPLLTLPLRIDALRFGDNLFFLTQRGLDLLVPHTVVVEQSRTIVEKILESDLIYDSESFRTFALKGYNPDRLLFFKNQIDEASNRLTAIVKNQGIRRKFDIKIKKRKIKTSSREEVEKLVKVLCDRGMLNPFDERAMEVSGATKWS